MKRFFMILVSLLILGGAGGVANAQLDLDNVPRSSDVADCSQPEGYEYVCYNEAECMKHMKGFGGVVANRFFMQKNKGWYPGITVQVLHINLYNEPEGQYLVGLIKAEIRNAKLYMKMWLNICDLEYNVLHEAYTEGFRGERPKGVKVWNKKK